MAFLALLLAHLGIVLFSGLALALVAYLVHSMLHPESF